LWFVERYGTAAPLGADGSPPVNHERPQLKRVVTDTAIEPKFDHSKIFCVSQAYLKKDQNADT